MTREIRENLRATDFNLEEVNRILGRLQDRLDELEGRRGTPVFYAPPDLQGNKITNAAQGATAGEVLTADLETTDLEISGGNLRVRLAETQGVQRTTEGIAVRVDATYGLTVDEVAGIRALVQDSGGVAIDSEEGLKADPANIDHGSLGGLADDDHTQYLNTTRHDTTDRHGDTVLFLATWQNYTSTTVNGFSGTPTKEVYYKKIGKLVFVTFRIEGTSNANNFNFTVPYTSAANPAYTTFHIRAQDNDTWDAAAGIGGELPGNSSTVTLFITGVATGWTTSLGKGARGHFFYEAGS